MQANHTQANHTQHIADQDQNRVTVSAIVLAGGQSSRMGQDKALIAVHGIPLLQQVCQVAQQCTDHVYVVTPWTDRYQNLLDPSIQLIQEHTLPKDHDLPHGPLVGFAQALPYIETEWVLLLACDLPQLQVEVIQQWETLLATTADTTIARLPQNPQGFWETLCGFYRRRCLPDLEAFIAAGGRSFQRWLLHQSVEALPVADMEMLLNCNTPADLSKIKE